MEGTSEVVGPPTRDGLETGVRDGYGVQLRFLPEGWFSVDVKENRFCIFLRNYPFEEQFRGVKGEFERQRYEARKRDAARRKLEREGREAHFEFYDPAEAAETLEVSERTSAAGRKGFDFFGLTKAFFGCQLKGITQVTEVYQELKDNPVLLQECFPTGELPSYDVLAAYERDMNRFELMKEVRKIAVETNIEEGINEFDGRLIVDVTHSEGNGKVGKKTKRCKQCHEGEPSTSCARCVEGKPCETPDLTDETIDIVHKNKGKVLKSHKYQISGTTVELPIAPTAFNGRRPDGSESFEQHLRELKADCGEWLKPTEIYVDGIYNNAHNRKLVGEIFPGCKLMSKPNPGNRKARKLERKGIEFTVDKWGKVTCEHANTFEFQSREVSQERYRFVSEDPEKCSSCPWKEACCPGAELGKTLRIPKECLSQYNWEDPEFGKRYGKKFNIRTGIERIIGRGKDLLGFRRQFKRGRSNVQGFGDRLVAIMNMIAYVAVAIGHPERRLRCRNFATG